MLLQGKFGRLDAVVNCAGIGVAFKVYNFNKDKAHTQEDFIKVMILRVEGTHDCGNVSLWSIVGATSEYLWHLQRDPAGCWFDWQKWAGFRQPGYTLQNLLTCVKLNTQRGVVINTASVAAFDGQMGQAAYSASKGAIVGMTLPLARLAIPF